MSPLHGPQDDTAVTRGRAGREVEIPAYAAMQNGEQMGARMLEILMRGVSTRNYKEVIPTMAETVGVSKSAVSRRVIEASEAEVEALLSRRFDELKLLVIYIDGLLFGDYTMIGAVGVDSEGNKHVLGIREGATENSTVVKELLEDIVARGVDPKRKMLFVIDGSKALRAAINAVFGAHQPVQRCRAHKLRNVLDHLPKEQRDQAKSMLRAAWKLDAKPGMARIRKLAEWLDRDYPSAAASLLEGLEECFTINRLGVPPSLMRCLATTNIIESPHAGVRIQTRRVTHWQNGNMVIRSSTTTLPRMDPSLPRRASANEARCPLHARIDRRSASGNAACRSAADGRSARGLKTNLLTPMESMAGSPRSGRAKRCTFRYTFAGPWICL